jgi:hypothetical protein
VAASGTDAGYTALTDCAYEPATKTVWVTNGAGSLALSQVNADLTQARAVALVVGGSTYTPHGVCAVGGKLYVAAYFYDGANPPIGRLFAVDPVGGAVAAVSVGASMQAARGVCYDAASATFYVVSDLFTYSGMLQTQPALWSLDRATLTAAQVAVSGIAGWPGFAGLLWVDCLYGRLWLSGYESTLHVLSPSGVVQQWRQFAASSGLYAGRVAGDGLGFLWYADPATGALHLLNPGGDVTTSAAVVAFPGGSSPVGVVALVEGVPPPLVT